MGIKPDNIIGHSVGELGCAYADGCFTAEQMILAAYSRGLASIETKMIQGSMAAIGLGYEEIKNICPPDIEVACHNGPDSCTISGPAQSMKEFVATLQVLFFFFFYHEFERAFLKLDFLIVSGQEYLCERSVVQQYSLSQSLHRGCGAEIIVIPEESYSQSKSKKFQVGEHFRAAKSVAHGSCQIFFRGISHE